MGTTIIYLNSMQDNLPKNAVPVIHGNLSSLKSDQAQEILQEQDLTKVKQLNILVSDSGYKEMEKCASSNDCILHVNVLRYFDDFIVPKSSVEAVGRLTKTQFNMLGELMTNGTNTDIAERRCCSYSTIKRHVEDIYITLNLKSRWLAVCAYLRYLMEYGSELEKIEIKSNHYGKSKRKSQNR